MINDFQTETCLPQIEQVFKAQSAFIFAEIKADKGFVRDFKSFLGDFRVFWGILGFSEAF